MGYSDNPHGTVEKHPAYGTVSLGRISGNTRLFGSDIKHLNWVHLTIKTAKLRRDLHRDWIHGEDEIIEVWLSPVQLAEAMFSMNHGDGVPCTLRYYRNKKGKLEQPDIDSMPKAADADTFKEEAKEMLAESVQYMKDVSKKLDEMIEAKGAKKSDIKELKAKVDKAKQHLVSNLPFTEESFAEALDQKTMRAKAEVEAFAESKLRALGLEAAQAEAKKMFSGSKEEVKEIEGGIGEN